VILGLRRQGLALARYFIEAGATVIVSDLSSPEQLQSERMALAGLPVGYVLGEHPMSLLDGCHLLCLSGGVPPQIPIVQEAIARGIKLSNDSLLTMQSARKLGLGPLVGITGSSGKTTTTTLVGKMLNSGEHTVHVGGNIGTPLLDKMEWIEPAEPIVLELSSFQLELFDDQLAAGQVENIGPSVAAFLNVTPNHLDRHPDMATYVAAKFNLVRSMQPGSVLAVNLDDPVTSRLLPDSYFIPPKPLPAQWQVEEVIAETRAVIANRDLKVVPFGRHKIADQGAWIAGDMLVVNGLPICRRDEVLLRGEHNISNILAAATISHAAGASLNAIADVARTFSGVPHRLEIVAQSDGITWINDSIATSPERAVAGLRSFQPGRQTLILLAGGKDKNLPWDLFANEVLARVSLLIGFGQSGSMIVNTVQERARFTQQKAPNCAIVQRLEEAVELAARAAGPNTVVLLSPGGTSFDAYRDFEQRGEHFRGLVHKSIESRMESRAYSEMMMVR
jgi:UDP-N-acetylmuramoylalanine--D-glutamate ligase